MAEFVAGSKVYKYDKDKLITKRIMRVCGNDMYELKDPDGGSKTSMIISEADLKKDWIMLSPDTLVSIACTLDGDSVPDVYVCVHKMEDLQNGESRPALMLRQNVYNDAKNEAVQMTGAVTNIFYVGEIRSIVTEQSYDYVKDFMDIKEAPLTTAVACYLDDNIQDIMRCIDKKELKGVDAYLDAIETTARETVPDAEGYCRSLSEFLTVNDFIKHYRSLFNIWTIDFKIETKGGYNKDGDIVLNERQIKRLEDEVKAHISDVIVIKYDKDIDISKIATQMAHVVVCDPDDKIYLIAYKVVSYYDEAGK